MTTGDLVLVDGVVADAELVSFACVVAVAAYLELAVLRRRASLAAVPLAAVTATNSLIV